MNLDFRDLLYAFNAANTEYLVVGAHALAAHGLIRATRDFDVWVRPSSANARRVLQALANFGAPLHDLNEADLSGDDLIFQIDVEPVRIDVITGISGVAFEDAWRDRVAVTFADQHAHVLSRQHLIANKRAAGRPQDLLDVAWIEREFPLDK